MSAVEQEMAALAEVRNALTDGEARSVLAWLSAYDPAAFYQAVYIFKGDQS